MTSSGVSGTEGYAAEAENLLVQYERVSFSDAHAAHLHLFPPAPCDVLDIGAGTGRDAAGLAERGYCVVAVEPTTELRTGAMQLHPSPHILWLDDSLPELGAVTALGRSFDVVILNAVWMHLDEEQRQMAMPKVAALLRTDGRLFLTLRHGPVPEGRRMFEVGAKETVALAAASHLQCVHEEAGADSVLNRAGVTWDRLVFEIAASDSLTSAAEYVIGGRETVSSKVGKRADFR